MFSLCHYIKNRNQVPNFARNNHKHYDIYELLYTIVLCYVGIVKIKLVIKQRYNKKTKHSEIKSVAMIVNELDRKSNMNIKNGNGKLNVYGIQRQLNVGRL